MTDYLFGFSEMTPLEVLAWVANEFDAHEAGGTCMRAYNEFLSVLADAGKRDTLAKLSVDEAKADELFDNCRRLATRFQTGLTQLFFGTDQALTEAAQRYGVF